MNIAIIGYGKMGKVIEKIAIERGHHITVKITSKDADFSSDQLKNVDVAIEFSVPKAAISNIQKCFDAGVPVIVGTTGWMDQLDKVTQECQKKNGGLFYASNFSIGVNIFFKVNQLLAKLMNRHSEYNVRMEEIHHTQKLDSPSGTALTIANQIIDQVDRKSNWIEAESGKPNQIPITAKRISDTPGTHSVTYENHIDKIEILHEAKGREGFATGAVLAAEYMKGKTGIHDMNNLLAQN
jgi:4-hydroxy-tetrahydrodipicolinate reductase